MFFKMSFHSFVPAEPAGYVPEPVKVTIREGACRYRFTVDGYETEGEGLFMRPQDAGVLLNVNYCVLFMRHGITESVKITGLEFSSAGVTIICTRLTLGEIEAAAEPAF